MHHIHNGEARRHIVTAISLASSHVPVWDRHLMTAMRFPGHASDSENADSPLLVSIRSISISCTSPSDQIYCDI